jgi:hypothetical protein
MSTNREWWQLSRELLAAGAAPAEVARMARSAVFYEDKRIARARAVRERAEAGLARLAAEKAARVARAEELVAAREEVLARKRAQAAPVPARRKRSTERRTLAELECMMRGKVTRKWDGTD